MGTPPGTTRLDTERNLTSALARRLSDEIVAGRLPPLTRLPTERTLMATYGVSRTVVREAIAALRAEGLVDTRQGSGAYVAADPRRRPFRIDPAGLGSIDEVLKVMELRLCVEVEAAGLAAERRSADNLGRLAESCRSFEAAVSRGDPATDLDFDFHAAIGSATGNVYFTSFLDFIGRMIIPRRTVVVGSADADMTRAYLRGIANEHAAIHDAIAAGNATAARHAMRRHLTRGRERYRRLAEGR